MILRTILSTTALTVTLATTPHGDQADGHVLSRPATRGAPTMVVDAYVGRHRVTPSASELRPGYTVFRLHFPAAHGHAALQLVRLRAGYRFQEFLADLERDDLSAVRTIDRNAVFYGGLPISHDAPGRFGTRLSPGTYWLFDFDRPRWGSFRVGGAPQRRSLPEVAGEVDMVMKDGNHRFATPDQLPSTGWMRQTNRTDEPHFMDLTHVKASTTRRQVRRALKGTGGSGWAIKDYPGSFLISPGRSLVWRYSFPPGKYLELCFWPSNEDGTTHAEMGMWDFVTLVAPA